MPPSIISGMGLAGQEHMGATARVTPAPVPWAQGSLPIPLMRP